MMSSEQYHKLVDKLDAFASWILGKDAKVGKRSKTAVPLNKPESIPPHGSHNELPRGRRPPGPEGPMPFRPRGMPPYARGPHPPFRDGPRPPHWRGPPPPHIREMHPQHFRDGPPPHFVDHPLPVHEGPPIHPIEGPLPPPHMRDSPLASHDAPQPHRWDRHGDHRGWRDSPPPHMIEGGPHRMMEGGPHPHMREPVPHPQMMEGRPPPHMIEPGPPREFRPHDGPPEHWRGGPQFIDAPPHPQPPMMPGPGQFHRDSPNMMERGPFDQGPYPEQPIGHPGMPPQAPSAPLDVNNILGQLMAFGVIKPEEPEVDEPVPEMPMKIDELKRRHRSIIKQLFLGMQCSSCGERFPESLKQQYSDHLDWHFRENKKEKEGVRKVASRSWYFDLQSWIETSELRIGKDGKVKSAFFELEKSEYGDIDSNLLPRERTSSFQSVPVEGDANNGVCGVCMDPLEEYWDEDLEEWRYKNAVREDYKTFHVGCFKDYVPYEIDETITPATTPGIDKSWSFDATEFEEDEKPITDDTSAEFVNDSSSVAIKMEDDDEPHVIKTEPESMEVDEIAETKDVGPGVVENEEVTSKPGVDEQILTDVQNKDVSVKLEEDEQTPVAIENENVTVKPDVVEQTQADVEQPNGNTEAEIKPETYVDSENTSVAVKENDQETGMECDENRTGEETNVVNENENDNNSVKELTEMRTDNNGETKNDTNERTADTIKVEANEDDYMDNADSPEFPPIVSSNPETFSNKEQLETDPS